MKRVKSRNETILYLTAPLTEKSVYKVSILREAWGSYLSFCESFFCLLILKRVFGENFLEGKEITDLDLIYKLWQPYLRSSKILECWNQHNGIWIETTKGFRSWLGGTW